MGVTLLITESVLFLSMIAASLYGAAVLPPGARVPAHFGPGYYNRWMPRNVGLALHPAVGAVIYAIYVVTAMRARAGGGSGPSAGLTIALAVLLGVQVGAVRAALVRSGRR